MAVTASDETTSENLLTQLGMAVNPVLKIFPCTYCPCSSVSKRRDGKKKEKKLASEVRSKFYVPRYFEHTL